MDDERRWAIKLGGVVVVFLISLGVMAYFLFIY